jgi:DNA-binding MarR family transcriptional regulator/GNAT superfamily N-acetyltransferase
MSVSADHIAQVRAFNRDYTRRIGILSEGLLGSPYSLTEVRVMYEIANRAGITAAELAQDLHLDRGYLSRILKRFEAKKLLSREISADDARRQHLRLTPAGKRVFAPLERRSQQQVRTMLSALEDNRRRTLLEAMTVIQTAFTVPVAQPEVCFRTHRPGDMGWVVERHGSLYFQEYGWNEQFEALVAEIAAEFIRKFDPSRERCWIAERDGRRVGCVFMVAKNRSTAKLRLFLVEPEARGLGLGHALVDECVRFARAVGYRRVVLWTQNILVAARHVYAGAGFKRTAQERHHSFGHDLVGETWELGL